MASNKKPSMYPDHGKVGSAEELEAYGVWVKSEPQDFTASFEAANFDAEALPYDVDFDTGFDDMGAAAGFDLLEPELHIPDMGIDDDIGGEDEGIDHGSEEVSNQFLVKIADELSAIRTELNTLKKEFAEIRGDTAGAVEDTDFFAGEEDEDGKIALSGDEMENIFTSTGLAAGEELSFDPGREADEAALRELSEQNEAVEEETLQELPALDSVTADDDFAMPPFDTLSFEEPPPPESQELEEVEGFAEELVPLEHDDEIDALRLEGAESLAPPPENTDYLEEDPFTLDTDMSAALDEKALSEVQEDTSLDAAISDTAVAEDSVSESANLGFDDLSIDGANFDIGLDDFSAEPSPEEPADEPSMEAAVDEPSLSEEIVEAPLEEPVLDDISFDLEGIGTDITFDDSPTEQASADSEPDVPTDVSEPPEFDLGTIELDAQADDIGTVDLGEEIALDTQLDDFGSIDFGEDLEPAADIEPTADLEATADIEPTADIEEEAALEPAADLEPAIDLKSTADLEEDIVLEPVAELETDFDLEPAADIEEEVALEPAADIEEEVALEPAADIEEEVALEPLADLEEEVALEPAADIEEEVALEPLADIEEEVALEPAADLEEEIALEPLADLEEEVALEPAADIEEDIVLEPVADLETDFALEPAADIEEEVALEPAADIEEEIALEPLADLEEEVALEPAADIEEEIALEPAADIEEEIALEPLADIEEEVALEPAADIEEEIALEPAADIEEEIALEPTLDIDEEIALEPLADFESDIVLEPAIPETKSSKAVAKPAVHAGIISDVDDSIAQVIPEGFEVNAKEADASLDDDLEAFVADEELAIAESKSADTGAITVEDSDEFSAIPAGLKNELKNVLSYMDHLLESLPEEKIEEFAQSEYFDKYKKIFKELGLV